MPESVTLNGRRAHDGHRNRRTREASKRLRIGSLWRSKRRALRRHCLRETSRRHRLLPPHLRFRREDVRRRKNPGRLHQARRTSPRARGHQFAPNRPSDSSALSRRISQRRSDRRDRALGRSASSTPTFSAFAPPARRSHSATSRSTRRSPRCASAATKNGKYVCNPTLPQYESGGMDIVIAGTRRCGHDGRGRRQRNQRRRLPRRGRVRARRNSQDRRSDRATREEGRQNQARVSGHKVDADLDRWVRKTFAKDVAKAMRTVDKQKREIAVRRAQRRRSAGTLRQERRRTSRRCSKIR